MPMDRSRYPDNWEQIAYKIKSKSGWKCQECKFQCLKPNEDRSKLTKSERTKLTLTVHHRNYKPEDNNENNLVALCSACHLYYHRRKKGSESIGQLSLFNVDDYQS